MMNCKMPHILFLTSLFTFHLYFLLANKCEGCASGRCGEARAADQDAALQWGSPQNRIPVAGPHVLGAVLVNICYLAF